MSKLTNEVKEAIIHANKSGITSREIAAGLGLGKSTVGDFLRKETYQKWWREHLKGSGQATDTIWDGPKAPTQENITVANNDIWHLPNTHIKTVCQATKVPDAAMKKAVDALSAMGNSFGSFKSHVPPNKPFFNDSPSNDIFKIVTSSVVPSDCTHFVIPDTQVKPGIDMSYLDHVGQYMADKQPAVIVMIGDHADMPSLSIYDKGTKKAEGKRIHEDFAAAIEGMKRLLRPIYDLQQDQLEYDGIITYKPKLVLTLGNHEERIMRHVNANPELAGFVSYDNLKYKEFGWEVIPFLKPINIHGVNYVHYMANPMTGRPYGGAALNILKQVGESFVQGHKQCLDVATRFLPASGAQQWAIIAGACYTHDEDYKGVQGNKHWRGVVLLNNVKEGSFNPMFVDLDYLKDRYEGDVLDNEFSWDEDEMFS